MNRVGSLCFCLFILSFHLLPLQADIFYSRIDGPWKSASTWSEDPSGSPVATGYPTDLDTVEIYHEVVLALNRHYTHFGNILIGVDARLETDRTGLGKRFVFAGTKMDIWGEFVCDGDFYVGRDWSSDTPELVVFEDAYFEIGDDLILCGGSATYIHTTSCGSAFAADDIYFRGPDAFMCGSGHFIVPDKLRIWDDSGGELLGAGSYEEVGDQLCDGFPIYADALTCEVQVPVVTGTGAYTLLAPSWTWAWRDIAADQQLGWQLAGAGTVLFWRIIGADTAGNLMPLAEHSADGEEGRYIPAVANIYAIQIEAHRAGLPPLRSPWIALPALQQAPMPSCHLMRERSTVRAHIAGTVAGTQFELRLIDPMGRVLWQQPSVAQAGQSSVNAIPWYDGAILQIQSAAWSLTRRLPR